MTEIVTAHGGNTTLLMPAIAAGITKDIGTDRITIRETGIEIMASTVGRRLEIGEMVTGIPTIGGIEEG